MKLLERLRFRSRWHGLAVVVLGAFFVAAGVNHFVNPDFYRPMMPTYLPAPMMLIYVSGFFEVLGGAGVLVPRLRRIAGWGLVALLIAVFPAHVHMVQNPESFEEIPYWGLVVRMPLQLLLIGWVWFATLVPRRQKDGERKSACV